MESTTLPYASMRRAAMYIYGGVIAVECFGSKSEAGEMLTHYLQDFEKKKLLHIKYGRG